MKRELLALAKERRQQQSKQFKPLSKLQLSKKQQSEPSLNDEQYFDEDEEQYEPSDEEILGYAEFIGIKLPEEEDLLYIARDGLLADLPEDWEEHETQDGNIIYINTRTQQITGEHPCDDYFRKLVIKQRNKRGTSSKNKYVGIQPIGSSMPQQKQSIGGVMSHAKKDIDPLVKMEMEKKKKKLEEQKRKQFQDKKKQITGKYEKKREDLETELKAIQKRLKKKYDQEIESQKVKISKKMSEQEKIHEEKKRKQMEKFERQLRSKLEKKYFDKRVEEKDKMEKKMKAKREEIRMGLQGITKSKKRELEDQFKEKFKILSDKQKEILKQHTDQQIFEKQVNRIKEQIVQKRIKQYSQRLQSLRAEQEKQYKTRLAELQRNHQQTLKKLEEEAPDNQIKYDLISQQVELFQKQELQAFEYQISKTKQLKNAQKQYQIEKLKSKLMSQHRQNLSILEKETENLEKKYRRLKEQEFKSKVADTEKNLNEQYLYSMKQFKKKFENEQQIIEIEAKPLKRNTDLQKNSLQMIKDTIVNLTRKQQTLRTQLQAIREEISSISKGYKPFAHKLSEQQNRMFELIKNHLDSNKGNQYQ